MDDKHEAFRWWASVLVGPVLIGLLFGYIRLVAEENDHKLTEIRQGALSCGDYGANFPERARNCDGVIVEDLSLSDFEREYKSKSCFADEWIYFDYGVECPNCGATLPPTDQWEEGERWKCPRCGLKLEASGNRLHVEGRPWQGERGRAGD